MKSLDTSVQYLKGVGPKRKERLNRLGVYTVRDLLFFIPREYEDRSRFTNLRSSDLEGKSSLLVKIEGPGKIIRPRRNMSILKVPFSDETGHGHMTWFNQPYLKNEFIVGEEYRINGQVKKIGMNYEVVQPIFELARGENTIGKIVPIYDLTRGISNNEIIKIMNVAMEEYLELVDEIIPKYIVRKYGLLDRKEAIKNIHFPSSREMLKRSKARLVYEELLILQLGLFKIKHSNQEVNEGIKFENTDLAKEYIDNLPFTLTSAQARVVEEIKEDMGKDKQMNRLVQGDVGSGKTVVAAASIYVAVKSGYQAAMMAPTEILASQHYESLKKDFDKLGIKTGLLVGSLSEKEKKATLESLVNGDIDVLIGTHAIIQDGVNFKNLALVITDEQHRFGVRQRAVLSEKGLNPDILVMTATPIPRTLALILYGDLEISIIDELPPGRKEIETYAVGMDYIERVNNFVEKQLKEGRQAYIVASLVEDSDSLNLISAETLYEKLKSGRFKDYRVGLLHGQMRPKDKDLVMEDFKNHRLDILVSTTVIEVGVDVPNSNIMVIYNAERFGLAQLHQLRGRVGRGDFQSYCILINASNNQIARERMRILQASTDGFVISEKDLEIRGPGEFFGTRQHGLPELKIANLFRDIKILKLAQEDGEQIIKSDARLEDEDHIKLNREIDRIFSNIGEDISLN